MPSDLRPPLSIHLTLAFLGLLHLQSHILPSLSDNVPFFGFLIEKKIIIIKDLAIRMLL